MEPTTTTLADLAVSHPAASRIFRAHGLDYCCGGRQTLADACAEKGLDPAKVLSEIDTEPAAGDGSKRWAEEPIGDLVDFIVKTYHQRLRSEIPELIEMATKVEESHAGKPTCPRGLAAHLRAMHAAVLSHLEKEEQILFPLIRAGRGSMAAGPIRVMEMEHDDHGASLARVRELTSDLSAPEDACATWRALCLRLGALEAELMEHIHLENNVLFPRALRG